MGEISLKSRLLPGEHPPPLTCDALLALVSGTQKPTVWSLLVTVFGDLAQDEGARISGAVLGRLTHLMGIKPEATRVALHRLRKDGWLASERRGRSSDYFLTPWGRAQSAAATPRIYAANSGVTDAWLVLTDPNRPAGGHEQAETWITASMMITTQKPDAQDVFATRIDETALPEWMSAKVCPPTLAKLSGNLADQFHDLNAAVSDASDLTPLEITALRVMIVHSWRRIVLKTPALPDHVFPEAWAGATCRALVSTLLQQLPRQALNDLEATAVL
ncbi:MAG: PaaX family transcriptional regulator C-terminal domain-containing protein [Pikeienuella sp.]